jgi:hypothetical protein
MTSCVPDRRALRPTPAPIRKVRVLSAVTSDSLGVYLGTAGSPLYFPRPAPWWLPVAAAGVNTLLEVPVRREAERRVRPLLDVAARLNFRQLCFAALDSIVDAASWPERRTCELTDDAAPTRPTRQKMLADVGAEALLIVESAYYLTPAEQFLLIRTKADLLVGDDWSPAYHEDFLYVSNPILAEVDSEVAEWVRQDGKTLRAEIAQGLKDTSSMISDDFFGRRGAPAVLDGKERFESLDPGSGARTYISGTLVSKRNGRVIVQSNDGQLYSLPIEFRTESRIFKQGEYSFYVWFREEERVSIHAHHPTGDAKIWMLPSIELAWNHGLTRYKVDEILKIARNREADIRAAWVHYHSK